MIFLTADQHYGHDAIIGYCNRPFANIKENDETIIANHNEIVTPQDCTIHAGDFCWYKRAEAIALMNRLNGTHIFIKGSHDRWLQKAKYQWRKLVKFEFEGKQRKQFIVVAHDAMRTWHRSHHGAWQCHGHCLDSETEILTDNGWRNQETISMEDRAVTLNLNSKQLEYNNVNEILNYVYTGKMYALKSSGLDLRVTEKHVMLDILRGHQQTAYRKFYAANLSSIKRRLFIKSGRIRRPAFRISNNQIKLLVWMAADGNICNTNLCRIRVAKARKMRRIKKLLQDMGIPFKMHIQKDWSASFNFTYPPYFNGWSFKPIDQRVAQFDRSQIAILLEEYSHTDGNKNGNATLIYTSKKQEADYIQEACITNGFICNIQERNGHGFSKGVSYTIAVIDETTRNCTNIDEKVVVEDVSCEKVWCIKTDNKTIMTRRQGKPVVVGNSHGRRAPIGLQRDVGVDCNGFYPVSVVQLAHHMRARCRELGLPWEQNNESD